MLIVNFFCYLLTDITDLQSVKNFLFIISFFCLVSAAFPVKPADANFNHSCPQVTQKCPHMQNQANVHKHEDS